MVPGNTGELLIGLRWTFFFFVEAHPQAGKNSRMLLTANLP